MTRLRLRPLHGAPFLALTRVIYLTSVLLAAAAALVLAGGSGSVGVP